MKQLTTTVSIFNRLKYNADRFIRNSQIRKDRFKYFNNIVCIGCNTYGSAGCDYS